MIENTKKSIHLLTVAGVASIAWCSFAFIHEVFGHGGSATFLGEKVLGAVSTTVHIDDFYDLISVAERIGWWGFRFVAAAGTVLNFFTAGIALFLLGWPRISNPATRYFLWLFSTISIFQQAFWMAVMPFASLGGDWTAFFIELEHQLLWKIGVTLTGVILIWVGIYLPFKLWNYNWGETKQIRVTSIRKLVYLPILYLFILQLLSVCWSPLEGPRHTTIVSVFTFIPIWLWIPVIRFVQLPRASSVNVNSGIPSNLLWLVAGLIVAILFVAVLGTGIGSFVGHPDYPG